MNNVHLTFLQRCGAFALLLLSLATTPAGWAAETAPSANKSANKAINETTNANALAQACRDDHSKHCAAVKPGGGRIAECLKQHVAELAPACQTAMRTMNTCADEVKKICGTQTAGAGALRDCAKSRASEFSSTCRAALPPQ